MSTYNLSLLWHYAFQLQWLEPHVTGRSVISLSLFLSFICRHPKTAMNKVLRRFLVARSHFLELCLLDTFLNVHNSIVNYKRNARSLELFHLWWLNLYPQWIVSFCFSISPPPSLWRLLLYSASEGDYRASFNQYHVVCTVFAVLHLKIISSRLIHFTTNDWVSIFKAELHFASCVFYFLFIPLSADRYVGCFPVLTITYNGVVNLSW